MLFHSPEYVFIFLPLAVLFYFWAWRYGRGMALSVLLISSLAFYSYWKPQHLVVLLLSILANYFWGSWIVTSKYHKKSLMVTGVFVNVSVLFIYKYYNFFVENFFLLSGIQAEASTLSLPLGVSFFTFVQIAYLVDCYRGRLAKNGLLEYSLFVTYFPHLIAGPIVHHRSLMTQFFEKSAEVVNRDNFQRGLFLFFLGLIKKVVVADPFGEWSNLVFDVVEKPSFAESWLGALAYTFQLYFDFSGYSDMAVGASLMMNIDIPFNFDSPYKAANITDFWRRWHISLSHWLRDYVYFPLGGNRAGEWRTRRNLFLTFVIGGIWHGAGWTFLIWGALHGLALVVHKEFSRWGGKIPKQLGIGITFLFCVICWTMFRAKTLADAVKIYRGMLGEWGFNSTAVDPVPLVLMCILGLAIVFFCPNSMELTKRLSDKNSRWAQWFIAGLLFIYLIITLNNFTKGMPHSTSEFLYFEF